MRISEMRRDMQEKGLLPPDKRDRKNKGVLRAFKLLKRHEAEERNEATPDERRRSAREGEFVSLSPVHTHSGYRKSK